MASPGQNLMDKLGKIYKYTPAKTDCTNTLSTAPYSPPLTPTLDRLPAFIVHTPDLRENFRGALASTLTKDIANNTVNLDAVSKFCETHASLIASLEYTYFKETTIYSEGDVGRIATGVLRDVSNVLFASYGTRVEIKDQIESPWPCSLVPGNNPLVDLGPLAIPVPAPSDNQILPRFNGRLLQEHLSRIPEHGSEGVEEELTTELNAIGSNFFVLPGYEPTEIFVTRIASNSRSPPPDSPSLLTPLSQSTQISAGLVEKTYTVLPPSQPSLGAPILHAHKAPFIGATGIVLKVTTGGLPFVIKAIPPGWKGGGGFAQRGKHLRAFSLPPRQCASSFRGVL
ncbi:hypothetical protein DFH09DRAFT_1078247 [Mycena vulgaris]|nr:hypothetical protein DFH09DRAFT_1078247 [Mycena vulgaris]